jgi:hypothetical protein
MLITFPLSINLYTYFKICSSYMSSPLLQEFPAYRQFRGRYETTDILCVLTNVSKATHLCLNLETISKYDNMGNNICKEKYVKTPYIYIYIYRERERERETERETHLDKKANSSICCQSLSPCYFSSCVWRKILLQVGVYLHWHFFLLRKSWISWKE